MTDGNSETAKLSDDPDLRAIQIAKERAAQELAAASARKTAAEADKAETDAKSAEFTAAFPAATTQPLEGKIEVGEKVGLIADLVAHAMIRRAAEEIRNSIPRALLTDQMRVLLVSSPDLIGSDWPYMAIASQIEDHKEALAAIQSDLPPASEAELVLQQTFTGDEGAVDMAMITGRAIEPLAPMQAMFMGPGAVLQAAGSVVGGLADIAALFRSDYGITARDVSIGTSPLLAALTKFIAPKVAEANIDGFALLEKSRLFRELREAARLRLDLQRRISLLKETKVVPAQHWLEAAKEARTAYTSALTAEHKPSVQMLAGLLQRAEELELAASEQTGNAAAARAAVGVAEAAIQRFDAFTAELVKATSGGYPPLVAAAIRERLHDPESGYTHVLYAGVEAAGGESISRRTKLKSTMRFMGGATATYLLWDVTAEKLVVGDTIPFLGEIKMNLRTGFKGGVEGRFLR